jgi:hypothetical protein
LRLGWLKYLRTKKPFSHAALVQSNQLLLVKLAVSLLGSDSHTWRNYFYLQTLCIYIGLMAISLLACMLLTLAAMNWWLEIEDIRD